MAADNRWSVNSQVPQTRIDSAGRPTRGILISFTITATQDDGEVFVPGDQPDPELARQRIREYVDRHLAVAELTS